MTYSYRANAVDLPYLCAHTMMPKSEKGKLLARNLAQGNHVGIDAAFLDLTVPTGDGRSTRFHSGCWMGMRFESLVKEPLRIVKDEILPGGAYEQWLTGSEGFRTCERPEDMPESAGFFSPSGSADLPEAAFSPLKTLLKEMPGSGIVEMDPEGLFVFLPHRLINKLPPSLKYPVTEAMIGQLSFPEIDNAYILALTLRTNGG